MRVIIDTNVLVSAILKDHDPEAVILFTPLSFPFPNSKN